MAFSILYADRFLYGIFFSDLALSLSPAEKIIKDLGFHRLHGEPLDFTLEKSDGKQSSLSDYKGRWIFLTFWATWCGACKTQMPSLESLHQEYGDHQLTILGVSSDQGSRDEVLAYLQKNEITFPIFLDQQGKASSLYQASSIPTTYLISPDFRLTGIARGAHNWEETNSLALIKELIAYQTIPEDSSSSSVSPMNDSTKVALPENLLPPRMKLILPDKDKLYVNREMLIKLEISWKGDQNRYMIRVPTINLPPEATLGKVSSFTIAKSDHASLEYHFPVTFKKEGSYQLGAIELSYRPRDGGKDEFTRIAGAEIVILNNQASIYAIAIAIATLIVASIIFLYFRRKRGLFSLPQNPDKSKWTLSLSNIRA